MMASGLSLKPPGIAWIGQFFVPLRALFPSVEAALLFSIILTQLAVLLLVYRTGTLIASGSRTAGLAASAFAAGGQIFVGLSHQYFVEPLQTLAVAWIVFLMLRSRDWPPARVAIHLAAASLLAMLAKASTPLYVIVPVLAIAIELLRNRQLWDFRVEWNRNSSRALLIGCAVAGTFGAIWYHRNFATVIQHIRNASRGEIALQYGFRAPVFQKFVLWSRFFDDAFFRPYLGWAAVILVVAAAIPMIRRRREAGWMLLFLAQIAIVIVSLSWADEMETRFLCPLGPWVAASIAMFYSLARYRPLRALILIACAAQWIAVNRAAFQDAPVFANQFPWLLPIATDDSRFNDLTDAIRRTSIEPGYNIVAVQEPWINENSAAFFAAKNRLDTGVRSFYTSIGYAQKDTSAALHRIEEFKARFVLDLDEPFLSPPNFLNEVTLPVLHAMKASERFHRVPMPSKTGIVIFERR